MVRSIRHPGNPKMTPMRKAVANHLLKQPKKSYTSRELSNYAGYGYEAVYATLRALEEHGVVKRDQAQHPFNAPSYWSLTEAGLAWAEKGTEE